MDRAKFNDSLARAKFRVKIKSLADEARSIRHEADRRKSHVWEWYSVAAVVRQHGRDVVSVEQRHTLLAYAFFRGKPYASCERSCRVKPDAKRVIRILRSLVPVTDEQAVLQWLAASESLKQSA